MSINALLTLEKTEVDPLDSRGLTPLHLCVISDAKTTRALRSLLIRGADCTIKDFKGRTPMVFSEKIEEKDWKQVI